MSSKHAVRLDVRFETDFPKEAAVKVVGSLASLGKWNIENAPSLTWDESLGCFHCIVTDTDVVGATEFEYKFTVRPPPPAASKLPQTQQAQQPSWLWAPGPNRKAALPAVAAGASPVTFGLSSAWMASRDGTLVIAQDGYMEPNRGHLAARYRVFSDALVAIEAESGGLDAFSRGYEYLGFNRGSGGEGGATPGIFYREWAPNAQAACLVGEFNGWAVGKHPCTRDAWGVWTLFMPDGPDGAPAIRHNTAVKLCLTLPGGGPLAYRLPAWIRYAVYDAPANEYVGRYWNPPAAEKHVWKHARRSTHTADDYRATPGMPRMQDVAGWTGAEPPPALKAPSGASRVLHPIAQPQQQGKQSAATSTAESKAAATAAAAARGPVDPAAAGLRIYEAHVGMAGEAERVSTYREFADAILPRIVATGYNCVQLMAVMEHAYYGSFGYHVTSFLAPSSRFGTPEDLKYLVDAAHAAGLLIIMDCVHSHASKNVNDGINNFDGTEFQYFHSGPRGNHDLWDSRLFDYSKREVQRFLLSSARLFVEEFRFDGYRFDGVTSMMYHHHGLSYGFSGDYNEYFGEHTDLPAMAYLMLVNTLLHGLDPPALSIAEDVSGMPTLCRPVWEGGVGFDYRLGMAIPDMWIKLLKEVPDDDWNMGAIVGTLTNRRWQERTIAYAESHDQALVGDKTLAFWLMDKEMYWHMKATESPPHPVIARGLALHKVIRLLTCALGGEAFLTFMGNEFGHPEWIDFPRVGNGWSYKHCRRQWSLVDNPELHYAHLAAFEASMLRLEQAFPWLESRDTYVSLKNEGDKVVVFDRGTRNGPLVFIFNMHPTKSFADYRVGVPCAGNWVIALDSDAPQFGGFGRQTPGTVFTAAPDAWDNRPANLHVYTCSRTVLVLKLQQ